jgi:MoaA/NifB/PqqE/SkfB family radical SAM enzyme
MIEKTYFTPETLKKMVGTRRLHIWGARHDGYAASLVFKRIGIELTGFIDSSLSLQGVEMFGYTVLLPDVFFAQNCKEDSFIIIASGFYADEISEICLRNNFKKLQDFLVYGELRKFNYQVDVSGSCNLRCISCPRGNYPTHRRPGFMSPETYEKLLKKILKDDPYTGIISLYNWGEPLLNKHLPDIIKITNKYSLLSAISSNLNLTLDFEDVIAARPTWFRISNSGWGKNYEITHTGGKWDIFYNNLFKLRDYQAKHHPDLIVELFFHIYEHNREDFKKMKELCDNLGFTIRYRHAALAPLDNIEKIIQHQTISEQAELTRKLQFLKVDEVITVTSTQEEKERPCFYEDHLWINWDLQVAHCMEWYQPGLNLVDQDFLSVSIEELLTARKASNFCKKCKSQGIHRVYCVYGDEKLIELKGSLKDEA